MLAGTSRNSSERKVAVPSLAPGRAGGQAGLSSATRTEGASQSRHTLRDGIANLIGSLSRSYPSATDVELGWQVPDAHGEVVEACGGEGAAVGAEGGVVDG